MKKENIKIMNFLKRIPKYRLSKMTEDNSELDKVETKIIIDLTYKIFRKDYPDNSIPSKAQLKKRIGESIVLLTLELFRREGLVELIEINGEITPKKTRIGKSVYNHLIQGGRGR